ncbi:synaptobrevin homolog YKT6 isoform X1 [Brachyistius frenatus]|uniref:synaptobrevin homolog YKT6 isoform X1 n=1 Tax=Brachyistius frenatus TaxID=100188 RepID=UPI0037E7231F
MKLYSLSILFKGATKANLLKAAYDLSSFSFFQRSSIQEFMTFTSALIVERTSQGSRASVKEQEYLCHVYVRNDNLGAVVIADTEYPQRVCFTLLEKVLEEFSRQVDSIDWPSGNPETINYKALDIHLSKYQNPREADAMTKVQAELDETKIILVNHLPKHRRITPWKVCWKEERSWMISWQSRSTWGTSPKPSTRLRGNRTPAVKSCDATASSSQDTPLSAFLLFLQLPSCTSHQLSTRTERAAVSIQDGEQG